MSLYEFLEYSHSTIDEMYRSIDYFAGKFLRGEEIEKPQKEEDENIEKI